MATPEKTDADVLADIDHVPGSADTDMSEPPVPRVGAAAAGPGDVAAAAAHPRVGVEPAEEAALRQQAVQQQQAQAGAGARTGAGPDAVPLVGADPDDEDEEDEDAVAGDMDDDDLDEDDLDDDEMDDEGLTLAEGAAMAPPEAGDLAIEDEPFDTSILPDAHAAKAAWNRERLAALPAEATPAGRTPGSSEDLGYGGGAPNEDVDVPGLDTGDGRLDDLADDAEAEEGARVEDAVSSLDDDDPEAHLADALLGDDGDLADFGADRDRGAGGRVASDSLSVEQGGGPDLSDNDDLDDGDVPPEELILATPGEDPLLAGVELGVLDDLDMEGLNESDDVARDLEDQRADMDDAASGNERQNQPG